MAKQVRRAPTKDEAAFPTVLLGAGLVIGLYSMAPAFVVRLARVRQGAEVVDHVVPGLIVLAIVGIALAGGSRSAGTMVISGMVVLLAGFWMGATHIGLLRQALDDQVSRGRAAFHCSTAVAVLGLGLGWLWRFREALREPAPA